MPSPQGAGAVVAEARELAGVSLAELARRMGVSWDTARQVEQGGDPRLSTLQAVIEALPFLGPASLLGGDPRSPPLGGAVAPWRTLVDLHGFVAKRVRLGARVAAGGACELALEVSGVRPLRGSLRDEDTRTNLLRAVVPGPMSFLRELTAEDADLRGVTREMTAGDTSHAFSFPRALERLGFSYSRRWNRQRLGQDAALHADPDARARAAETLAHDVTFPARRLELAFELPHAARCPPVAFFAAPDTAAPPLGAFELARAHLPRGVPARWDARKRTLSLAVERPLLAMRYGLAFLPDGEDATAPFASLPPNRVVRLGDASLDGRARHVGERVRRAREAAGISRRELAQRMGVSPATVMELEAGKDPRRSTVLLLLRALPDLRPADLFTPSRSRDALTPAAAWAHQRNLFGAEADAVARTVILRRTGSAEERIETSGLRRVHRARGPLVVKDGIATARHGRVGPVFLAGRGSARAGELRVRWEHEPGLAAEYYLALPERLVEGGASFTRKERKDRAYKMRADMTGRSIGPAFECVVPARCLVLEVRFPHGWWPPEVAASVRAAATVTNPRWPDLKDEVHAGGYELVLLPHAGTARLTVERPLIGLRYSIRWRAP